jgi:hypothetical protein
MYLLLVLDLLAWCFWLGSWIWLLSDSSVPTLYRAGHYNALAHLLATNRFIYLLTGFTKKRFWFTMSVFIGSFVYSLVYFIDDVLYLPMTNYTAYAVVNAIGGIFMGNTVLMIIWFVGKEPKGYRPSSLVITY